MNRELHKDNAVKLDIKINSKETLFEACDYLHDARMTSNNLAEDGSAWTATFEREYFEDKSLINSHRRFLIFRKIVFPLIETTLTISGIRKINNFRPDDDFDYMFNEVSYDEKSNVYRFLFCENYSFEMEFDNLPSGNMKDMETIDKQGSFWTIGDWKPATKED